ncbi:3-methyl-2-oxobutanoate hydroxymethyltransferase [Acetobacter estunensis]|uniref:3-methyl-2-oxobutanoate hydroxymethyltransferase n=1 Tax=Acetobacter estunensis TaxID=104097 RepID=A0A967BBR6_9PROT|nr:3-methyl-2-oxobutanoate hydroxymethyltransferase [Acetobacter estunensis]NHO53462.1 3-methyl-2-oxobutanoate hydroxymethyltransferase [Acetobacter estunensis]
MRITVADVGKMKNDGERIAMVTVYDYSSALIAERAGVPLLLVGDSLGMVMLGHDTTLPVTLDDMIHHASAVMRASRQALVIADLPFLSYATIEDAVQSAQRLMQESGVQAVKLEGGACAVPQIRRLVEFGVPVMGHLGLTPQSQHQIGLRVQGRRAAEARKLLEDALALQEAGAFALVLEVVPAPLAKAVSERLDIPVIGIGAGVECDGQVQVWHDVLGLFEGRSPRHAKRFAEIGAAMEDAIRTYVNEVRSGTFPTDKQSAKMDEDELTAALTALPPKKG